MPGLETILVQTPGNWTVCCDLAAVRRAFITDRFRAKREQIERLHELEPERQGQNLALTVSYVPYALDSSPD